MCTKRTHLSGFFWEGFTQTHALILLLELTNKWDNYKSFFSATVELCNLRKWKLLWTDVFIQLNFSLVSLIHTPIDNTDNGLDKLNDRQTQT